MPQLNWLNSNEGRSYPFLAGLTGQAVTGPLTLSNLPNETIVDCGFLAGLSSEYVVGESEVYLYQVRRQDSFLYFEFRSTAPGLYGVPLVFTRSVTDGRYITERQEEGTGPPLTSISDDSISVNETSVACVAEPLWSGFLVTGDLSPLLELLPGDGSITAAVEGDTKVEPGTVQSLVKGFVRSINLANEDRTRADLPLDCGVTEWPVPAGDLIVYRRCLIGEVRFRDGFNSEVQLLPETNTIEIIPGVGSGEGQPCTELQLSEREVPINGSPFLSGGRPCNSVLRSVNGIGGPRLPLLAGPGVGIDLDVASSRIVIDVDMRGQAVCFTQDSEEV